MHSPLAPTAPADQCVQCGAAVSPTDRFCGGCGHPLSTGDPTWGPVADRLREVLADEFELEGELGRGGMAAVFRAREIALSRRVAIKVMAPGLLLGEGMAERFRQEAITVANLQHANIVAVHGVRTVGDLHFFVMQYVPGRSLERVLRDRGHLSIETVRAIVYHVGSALDYAHRRGVVHRDVKPANILLDADGDPVVTDFGIAKVAEAPGHTRVGTVVGTPEYMSPEQCTGADVGPASDQYALGIVAYEMLTGRPPFTGSGMALLRSHTDESPAPISAVRADLPTEIDTVIGRMLAKHPGDRFPDLATAVEAFGAQPLAAHGALRAEMAALAAPAEAETHLAEIVRTPRTPRPAATLPPPAARAPAAPAPPAAPAVPLTLVAPPNATAASDVATLTIAPLGALRVGDCVTLAATAHIADGRRVRRPITWRSTDPGIAAVDPSGRLTAVSAGWAIVTAECGGATARTEVVVRQQIVPVSTSGRRESRRLVLRWWALIAILAGTVAIGWRLLGR